MFGFRTIQKFWDDIFVVLGSVFLLNFPQNITNKKSWFFFFPKLEQKYVLFEFLFKIYTWVYRILRQEYTFGEVAGSANLLMIQNPPMEMKQVPGIAISWQLEEPACLLGGDKELSILGY